MIRSIPQAAGENASQCLHLRDCPDETSFDVVLDAHAVVSFFILHFSALTIGLYSKHHCQFNEASSLQQA
jgi:hypothetical protein